MLPFLFRQISTNVLRIPVLVTKTQIVQTVKVLTAVFVNKDSMGMAYFVKVNASNKIIEKHPLEILRKSLHC